jgi:hypothetical protein
MRANPVLWFVWVLLGGTVIAGLSTLAIALRSADRPLPETFHWEGPHLDRDFALARNAATHGTVVSFSSVGGECRAVVSSAPNDAPALNLLFAHGSDASLDRALYLKRIAPGDYRAACAALPAGRWRVALEDSAGQWAIREELDGDAAQLTLRARNPEGP